MFVALQYAHARQAGDVNAGWAGETAARAAAAPGAGQHARVVPARPQVPHTQGLRLPQVQASLQYLQSEGLIPAIFS